MATMRFTVGRERTMEASSWPLQISDTDGGQGDEEYGITDRSAAVTAAPWPCKLKTDEEASVAQALLTVPTVCLLQLGGLCKLGDW